MRPLRLQIDGHEPLTDPAGRVLQLLWQGPFPCMCCCERDMGNGRVCARRRRACGEVIPDGCVPVVGVSMGRCQ
jgi:hypothetical protein